MSVLAESIHTFSQIWRNPQKTKDAITAFQNRKLRSIIANAYQYVKYYRQLFDAAGIKPQDIKTIEDLSLIPITSTQDYRTRPLQDVLSSKIDPKKTVKRSTSGSSGRPFTVHRTSWEDHLINFFHIRVLQQFGVLPLDKTAHVRLVSASHQRDNIPGAVRQALGIHRVYPIHSLLHENEIIHELSLLKPDIVFGYPTVLAHIAGLIGPERSSGINPKFIIAGGESLTPFRRQEIERGFGKRVFGLYGAHEFNKVAWECPDSGDYHVCDDNLVLEVLQNGRPAAVGEQGEVVATGLHSYAMPFIRYRLGDIVTRGPEVCSCGQPFSTLRAVQGRLHDYFRLPNGRLMHPDKIVVPIMESESGWFNRYELIQEEVDRILLRIQPFQNPSEGQLVNVKRLAMSQLPSDVEFRIEIIDEHSFKPEGKFRFCRSMVHSHTDKISWDQF
ncbi:MAG: phenylacetate--CoA ligase family protein [Deltaproteobacteria bacterium]|nr:phenylacetate--CoA ligase family protein [Deltaproteobacteria bacterium]MBW2170663.1 phenylacetate--CoA ligase family protein [Deltaproteobacteria bacterium]